MSRMRKHCMINISFIKRQTTCTEPQPRSIAANFMPILVKFNQLYWFIHYNIAQLNFKYNTQNIAQTVTVII